MSEQNLNEALECVLTNSNYTYAEVLKGMQLLKDAGACLTANPVEYLFRKLNMSDVCNMRKLSILFDMIEEQHIRKASPRVIRDCFVSNMVDKSPKGTRVLAKLQEKGFDINTSAPDKRGGRRTALQLAVDQRKFILARILLEAGADPTVGGRRVSSLYH